MARSRRKRPSASTSDPPVSGDQTGRPSVRLKWSPSPSSVESLARASSSGWTGRVARTVVLVTMPSRCARRMPRLTPSVTPKSSALTMSRRFDRSPRTAAPRLLAEGAPHVLAHLLGEKGLPPAVGHRVLEQLEIEHERRRRLLPRIELDREHALLVRLGEDRFRPREGAVF